MKDECIIKEPCLKFWENSFELGRGKSGIVYSSKICKTVALKLSTEEFCTIFKDQFDKQIQISNCFSNATKYTDKYFSKRVCILRPRDFIFYESGKCSFKMRRIFQFEEFKEKPLVQAYLDQNNIYREIKGRGTYLGIKQLMQLLENYSSADINIITTNQKIESLISDLGTAMGILNTVCGLTNQDIEIVIGRPTSTSKNYKMYIIDFDEVLPHNFDVSKVIWGYEAEPYYPVFNDSPFSNLFWKNYNRVARLTNHMQFAKQLRKSLNTD